MTRTNMLFNSHPHKEDDDTIILPPPPRKPKFSTHILTRRMTDDFGLMDLDLDFSTHILTRRMTNTANTRFAANSFQLTSSQGG